MKETKFKDTEIGRIPEEWEIGYFGDVLCTFSAGATPYRGIPDYYNGKINWISSGELNYNVIYDTIEHISEEALRNTNLCLHAPGTFLMAITGLEATGTRGKCAFVGAPSATNQSCLAINGTNKMDIKYLYWYYRMYGDYLAFKYSQGTKQQSFTATIVKNLPITYPKQVIEQHHIASALTSIDNLIASLGKLIEKKKNIKQGAMQQLLTGQIRLKGFSEPWGEKKLEEVCSVKRGVRVVKRNLTTDGLYPVYQNTNFPLGYSNQYNVEANTPFVIIGGSAGQVGICRERYWAADDCAFFACHDIYKEYLYYVLLLNQSNILHNVRTGTIPRLDRSFLSNMVVYISSNIDEQQAIATILTKMDDEITALEAKRAKYEAIKQGMMQQLLTGKIRLIG